VCDVGDLFVKDGAVEYDEVSGRVDEAAFCLRKVADAAGRTAEQTVNTEGDFAYIHGYKFKYPFHPLFETNFNHHSWVQLAIPVDNPPNL